MYVCIYVCMYVCIYVYMYVGMKEEKNGRFPDNVLVRL
jgi:hypothetical protein